VKALNSIVAACPPSGIRKFFDLAAGMPDVISLGVGEPDFLTPWRVREAGIFALEKGLTTYTSNAGLVELRSAICDDLERRHGIRYGPEEECLVTAGVSQGLDLALRAMLEPGDEVLVPEPCYVAYKPCVSFAGGLPVAVPTEGSDGFRIDIDRVASLITNKTKALVIGSPANPTGAVQSRENLNSIVTLAVQHDLYIISDEIYERLSYLGPHTCVAALPGARERTILLNGFSKAYAMTGWRVGYVCAPPMISDLMQRMHQYTLLCAPHVAQAAALEAIIGCEDDVNEMVADYDRRRRMFVDGLRAIGLECTEPGGGFYAFPSVAVTGLDSANFAEQLLVSERVAVVPGTVFGDSGEGYIRCCYATGSTLLEEAVDRMGRFIAKYR